MNLETVFNILQIVIVLLLIGAILMQRRGGGLSSVFGGDSAVYRTKRGAEKIIFYATIVLAILFFVTAGLNVFV